MTRRYCRYALKLREADEQKRSALALASDQQSAELSSIRQRHLDEIEQIKHVHKVQLATQLQEFESSLKMHQRLREEV